MEIRKVKAEEIDRVMEIYAYARKFQAEHGNPNQWTGGYPQREIVERDQENGELYCVTPDGDHGTICGVFMFSGRPEPDYTVIEGHWKNQEPYSVIHRVASDGTHRGVGKACIDWAFSRYANLKMDTHEDNTVMQNMLIKNGFTYCGVVHIRGGETRLAYQKTR